MTASLDSTGLARVRCSEPERANDASMTSGASLRLWERRNQPTWHGVSVKTARQQRPPLHLQSEVQCEPALEVLKSDGLARRVEVALHVGAKTDTGEYQNARNRPRFDVADEPRQLFLSCASRRLGLALDAQRLPRRLFGDDYVDIA